MKILLFVLMHFFSEGSSVSLELITADQLKNKYIQPNNDTLYVVNFWATWCKPCVAEMPYFMEAGKKYKNQKVKIIFVSLDSVKDKERVKQFLAQKGVADAVYLLNETNPNVWIDKIETTWGGSIPATIFYRSGKKIYFREVDFTETELNSIIETKIK